MSFRVTTTVRHLRPSTLQGGDRPPTIWEALAAKLGREPTDAEAGEEVRRILREAGEEARAPHARRRGRA